MSKHISYCMPVLLILSIIFTQRSIFAQQNSPAPDHQEVLDHMLDLVSPDGNKQVKAGEWLEEMNDISVAPAFIDAMFLVPFPNALGWQLKRITGKSFQRNWPRWMEWLSQQEFRPHPAYYWFKHTVFKSIDPAFGDFLYPHHKSIIRWEEILWGGVKKDSIPTLNDPQMIPAAAADYLKDKDPVFGLEVGGEAHAYPLKILNWHELLNTNINGTAITLVYCTLCGAAIAYKGNLGETTFTFGTSGLLYRSNKLMYDKQTNSLWSSIYGKPVVGTLVEKGLQLEQAFVVRASWKEWKEAHPNTKVLDLDTGFKRDYLSRSPYEDYFESKQTMFPVGWKDKRLKAKDWVYGVLLDSIPRAYPLKKLKGTPVLNDAVGSRNLVIVSEAKQHTVRVYERREQFFSESDDESALLDADGNNWEIYEDHLFQPDQELTLKRLPGHLSFWFAWFAFFQNTEIWEKTKR